MVLIQEQNTHGAHLLKGAALYIEGKYEEAISEYNRALEIKPEDPVAHNAWASTLVRMGKYRDAVFRYGIAIGIDPKCTDAYVNRGNTLYRLGSTKEAVQDYIKAVKSNPLCWFAYKSIWRATRAKALEALKNIERHWRRITDII